MSERDMNQSFTHQADGGTTRVWIVRIGSLAPDHAPSAPVWYNHAHTAVFEGERPR